MPALSAIPFAVLALAALPQGDDPETSRILKGPNDWLFRDLALVDSFTGNAGPTTGQLRRWHEVIEARQLWCAARDIPYVFAVAPDKHEIYPEEVPEDLRRGKSICERFFGYMERREEIEAIDLRPVLLDAKDDGLLYYQYGSHWNWRAGFLAYRVIAERLGAAFPGLDPWELDEFEVVDTGKGGDDLRGDIEGGLLLPPQEVTEYLPKRLRKAVITDYWDGKPTGLLDGTLEQVGADLPRCLFLRDSFANWIWPFLGEHFAWMRLESRVDFDPAFIESHDPDAIVHVLVERKINGTEPEAPGDDDEIDLYRDWLEGVAPKAKLGGENEAERALAVVAEGTPLPLDFSNLGRGRDPVLRLELDAAAEGVLTVRWRRSRSAEDSLEFALRGGHQWLFLPFDAVYRHREPGVVLSAEGDVTVRAWALRAVK